MHDEGLGAGPVAGWVYWPRNVCTPGPPAGDHPLVLLTHGDGHDYQDYGYLMRHLARNGFIAATIDNPDGLSNVERAERVRTYLDFMRNHWTYAAHVENKIALIGHSRGGEAIFTAARKIQNDWGLDHQVTTLIALAPTDSDQDNGPGGGEGLESLDSFDAGSLLVMYGSLDNDVYGYCTQGTDPDCGTVPTGPQETGFALYDRAGGEVSTETFILHNSVTKSMLFIDHADHNRWLDDCSNPNPGGFQVPLDCDTHHDIARGYMNAFLRWRLRGEDQYRPFFTGEAMPASVAAEDVRVRTQFVRGPGRRSIDNFSQPGWTVGSNATVSKNNQVTILKEGTLFDYGNFTIPHDTDGLVLRWSTLPLLVEPWIRWTLDDTVSPFGFALRDVSGFDVLSFRAGQIYDAAENVPAGTKNFTVQLRDEAGTWSPRVHVEAFTELAYPDVSSILSPIGLNAMTTKSSMQTVRIPLHLFAGVDLTAVQDVQFGFGDDDHTEGELVIDSLEFSD